MMAAKPAKNQSDTPWPRHAVVASDRQTLATILLPEVTLAVWQRAIGHLPIDTLPLAAIDDIRLDCPVADAGPAVRAQLAAARYPANTIAPLAEDIAALAAILADLLDKDDVQIRLETIDTDACSKFHADYVSVRLINTYAGPGTQWLDQHDAARLADGVDPDELTIRDIRAGQVALFKGRDWNAVTPIVHRSPPILGSGVRRLVLVIDPAPRRGVND